MKRIVGILSVLVLISCSPDAKLIAENEELKSKIEKLTEHAQQSAAEARNAQAEAMKAAEEAQMQAAAARASAEEALRQKKLAEEALKKCK